jgi:hypothetical protein
MSRSHSWLLNWSRCGEQYVSSWRIVTAHTHRVHGHNRKHTHTHTHTREVANSVAVSKELIWLTRGMGQGSQQVGRKGNSANVICWKNAPGAAQQGVAGCGTRSCPTGGSPDAEPGVAQQGVEQWSCSAGCGTRSQGVYPLTGPQSEPQQTTSSI